MWHNKNHKHKYSEIQFAPIIYIYIYIYIYINITPNNSVFLSIVRTCILIYLNVWTHILFKYSYAIQVKPDPLYTIPPSQLVLNMQTVLFSGSSSKLVFVTDYRDYRSCSCSSFLKQLQNSACYPDLFL